jgi:Tlde1 domain
VLGAAAIAALITIVPEWVAAGYVQTRSTESSPPVTPVAGQLPLRLAFDPGNTQTAAARTRYFVASLSSRESPHFVVESEGSETMRQDNASIFSRDRGRSSRDVPIVTPPKTSTAAPIISAEAQLHIPLPVRRPIVAHQGETLHKIAPSSDARTLTGSAQNPSFGAFAWLQKIFRSKDAQKINELASGTGSRTAVYDIKGHRVYLPNGEKLEAHSGLGKWLDDVRYVNVRDRGPTPPNVYQLALRESPFHGVQAIRLNPIGSGNMYGRKGILAHPYMLGANGQSNGCVSVQDYSKFLRAFLKGEISRLIVVADLAEVPARAKYAQVDASSAVY